MRIGIITNTYPPNLNGVSMAVKSLEKGLQEKGVEVFIATPKVQGVDYPSHVLAVKSIPTSPKVSPDLYIPYLYIDEVVEFFRENKVDLVHTHDIFAGAAEGIVVALKLDVPSIHTFHTFVEQYSYFSVPGRRPFIRGLTRLVCNNYDHITAPSLKVYKYLAQIGFKTPVTQILNVPSSLHLKKLPRNQELAKKYGIKPDDFVFITFCRIAKEKSVEIGLVVLHALLKKYPNTKYIIAGQGPEIESLHQLAQHLGIGNSVIFTGKYQPEELNDLGSLANVFVFTSHTENLPTNLLEAMALGLPVLSVDDESVDYLLEPGVNGYKGSVDQLSETANTLYHNPELVEHLSMNALRSAQALQSADVTQQYVELYERVIRMYNEKPKDPGLVSIQMKRVKSLINKVANLFKA